MICKSIPRAGNLRLDICNWSTGVGISTAVFFAYEFCRKNLVFSHLWFLLPSLVTAFETWQYRRECRPWLGRWEEKSLYIVCFRAGNVWLAWQWRQRYIWFAVVGITSRLHYFKEIGIETIWISPFYKSPMEDFGYDISDFMDIDPIFGTMKDFEELAGATRFLGKTQ